MRRRWSIEPYAVFHHTSVIHILYLMSFEIASFGLTLRKWSPLWYIFRVLDVRMFHDFNMLYGLIHLFICFIQFFFFTRIVIMKMTLSKKKHCFFMCNTCLLSEIKRKFHFGIFWTTIVKRNLSLKQRFDVSGCKKQTKRKKNQVQANDYTLLWEIHKFIIFRQLFQAVSWICEKKHYERSSESMTLKHYSIICLPWTWTSTMLTYSLFLMTFFYFVWFFFAFFNFLYVLISNLMNDSMFLLFIDIWPMWL